MKKLVLVICLCLAGCSNSHPEHTLYEARIGELQSRVRVLENSAQEAKKERAFFTKYISAIWQWVLQEIEEKKKRTF